MQGTEFLELRPVDALVVSGGRIRSGMSPAFDLTEWLLVLSLLATAVALVFRRSQSRPWLRWSCLGVGLAVAVLALAWDWKRAGLAERQRRFEAKVPYTGRPGGYVTSDTCRACHPDQYETWHQSFHRTMTQYASPAAVQADFNHVRLTLEGENYLVWRDGEEYWAELPDPEWKALNQKRLGAGPAPMVKKRIGLLTGSHHMQIFWVSSATGNQQLVFPFAWLIGDRKWVPVHNTFLRDPTIPPQIHVWNVNCLKCHSTGGQPRPDMSLGGLATRVGELGIACESCHGPAETHVGLNQNPLRRYLRRQDTNGDPSIVNPARLAHDRSSQACGQCHGIKWIPNTENFSEQGFSYRPGQDLDKSTPLVRPTRIQEQPFMAVGLRQNPRFLDEHYWSDGMVRVSGRDFNGTVESPCYQKGNLSCLSCHSMHSAVSPASQMGVGREANEACLQCHETMRGRVEQHTHHATGSAGGECYNCHMPHTTYGLLKAIRSHQITSPSVTNNLQTGRPNACNLCHLDRTLDWTADRLAEWYRQPRTVLPEEHRTTAASVLWAVKGDAGQRALMAWHFGWEPAKRASRTDWLAPYLGVLLNDPYSAVRYIAHRSLKRLPGFGDFEFDFVGSPPERALGSQRAATRWRDVVPRSSSPLNETLLLTPAGDVNEVRLQELLRQRDDRSMDLQE